MFRRPLEICIHHYPALALSHDITMPRQKLNPMQDFCQGNNTVSPPQDYIGVPCGLHQGSVWTTSGFLVDFIRFLVDYIRVPCGLHQVPCGLHQVPCGLHQGSLWTTSGFLVDYIRVPCGLHQGSVWTTSEFRVDYIRVPCGLHQGSLWTTSGFLVDYIRVPLIVEDKEVCPYKRKAFLVQATKIGVYPIANQPLISV